MTALTDEIPNFRNELRQRAPYAYTTPSYGQALNRFSMVIDGFAVRYGAPSAEYWGPEDGEPGVLDFYYPISRVPGKKVLQGLSTEIEKLGGQLNIENGDNYTALEATIPVSYLDNPRLPLIGIPIWPSKSVKRIHQAHVVSHYEPDQYRQGKYRAVIQFNMDDLGFLPVVKAVDRISNVYKTRLTKPKKPKAKKSSEKKPTA